MSNKLEIASLYFQLLKEKVPNRQAWFIYNKGMNMLQNIETLTVNTINDNELTLTNDEETFSLIFIPNKADATSIECIYKLNNDSYIISSEFDIIHDMIRIITNENTKEKNENHYSFMENTKIWNNNILISDTSNQIILHNDTFTTVIDDTKVVDNVAIRYINKTVNDNIEEKYYQCDEIDNFVFDNMNVSTVGAYSFIPISEKEYKLNKKRNF